MTAVHNEIYRGIPQLGLMCEQVSSPLIRRVTKVDTQFIKELEFEPRVAAEFDFQLDSDNVLQAIHAMDFFELKGSHRQISVEFHIVLYTVWTTLYKKA